MKTLRPLNPALRSTLLIAAASLAVSACGSSKDSAAATDETPAAPVAPAETINSALAKLDSSGAVMNFALNALNSSMKGSASTALALQQDDPPHPVFPQCSEHGEAYVEGENRRMEPSDAGFSEATLFCQLNVSDSSETILGSLTMAKKVLCTVEKSLGKAPEYTAAGKTYSNVKLTMSKDCGWRDSDIAEMADRMPAATLVTKELASGDWKRQVTITLPGVIDFKLFYTVQGDTLAIKKVEGWTQEERCSGDSRSCNNSGQIADSAKGSRGDVIAVDLKSGTLRAETSDNYWGRRSRSLIKGTLAADGKFSAVSNVEMLYSTLYVMPNQSGTYVFGKVASAKGSADAGILFKGGGVQCGQTNGCALDSFGSSGAVSGPAAVCSKSGGCAGNSGFNFAFSNAKVLDFMRLGADFDAKGGSRTKNEEWLAKAGIPKFSSVDFGATVD